MGRNWRSTAVPSPCRRRARKTVRRSRNREVRYQSTPIEIGFNAATCSTSPSRSRQAAPPAMSDAASHCGATALMRARLRADADAGLTCKIAPIFRLLGRFLGSPPIWTSMRMGVHDGRDGAEFALLPPRFGLVGVTCRCLQDFRAITAWRGADLAVGPVVLINQRRRQGLNLERYRCCLPAAACAMRDLAISIGGRRMTTIRQHHGCR